MQKQVLFIYQRSEITVFVFVMTLIACFTFTLGLHLGKKIAISTTPPDAKVENIHVKTVNDRIPNLQELTAPGKVAFDALDQTIQSEAKSEVNTTGIHVNHPATLDFPANTRSTNAGATTLRNLKNLKKIQSRQTHPPHSKIKPYVDTTNPTR